MPKSRGNNTVGNTGSGGSSSTGEILAGSVEELSNRISNRLSEAGPVIVAIDSRTRGREEHCIVTFDQNDNAHVQSASGNTYLVNSEGTSCTCLDHRMRGAICRHIRAAEQARGQILNRPISSTSGEVQSHIQNNISNQIHLDQQAEAHRQQLTQEMEDDGFFYTDPENEQAFNDALERARFEPLGYDYDNALNGSNVTFGLEIEFEGGNKSAIARELYDMGIISTPYVERYHSQGQPGKWKIENDGSLIDGAELVSPVLRDTPETWRQLEKICEVVKRHGGRISPRCGGHVHIGMDPLDTARQRWKRFFKTIGGYEPELYRLAGGTEGRVRSSAHEHYAAPFGRSASMGFYSTRSIETINDVRQLTQGIQRNRYHGINLTNIWSSNRPDTVEFRYFNSSLDHRQIQANVKIANGIMIAAEKARINDESGTTEFMKKRGNLIKETQFVGEGVLRRNDNSGIRRFIDICFTRKKDKDEILKVFAKNNWAV